MTAGIPLLLGTLTTWLTPLWLISVGTTLGLVVLAGVYGVLMWASPKLATGMRASVQEGILLTVFYLAVFLSVFALAGTQIVPLRPLWSSVARLGQTGPLDFDVAIAPATKGQEIPLPFRGAELKSFRLSSDQPLSISTRVGSGPSGSMRVGPSQEAKWARVGPQDKSLTSDSIRWTATNATSQGATLQVHAETDIEYPEVRVIFSAALAVLAFAGLYFALRFLAPKVSAIALTTSKEAVSQPLFYVTLAIGLFALLAFIFIPYNTFGEDVKMLKDSGLTLIMVLSIIVAVWSASVSVAEEVEGRTALTLLSKPIRRWQFILGKFLGVLGPIALLYVVLGLFFMLTVSYKVVYDARESAQPEPVWQICFQEVMRTLPGLALGFMEAVVLAAISVAISTRLPAVANLIVCATVYVLGHLVPPLVNSSVGRFEGVHFIGQVLGTILPVLDHFNIQPAISGGVAVPGDYLIWATAYCLLYCTIAMLLALVMFEDRDLA